MAKSFSLTILLLALTITLGFVNSARVLNDVTVQTPNSLPPLSSVEDDGPSNALPSGQFPASTIVTPAYQADQPQPNLDDTPPPLGDAGENASGGLEQPSISFYMHNVPSGVFLQKLMFQGESITGIDDELAEGPELGSGVIGKGQGFYMASSLDGESHTMAFTAFLTSDKGHDEDDTVSFFGVHRTASPVSHIAVVGGTGKYEDAKGYATIEALPQVDQHTTDGIDTIAHITVYIY